MSDGGTGTGTTTPPVSVWYDGLDDAHRGHVVARGWHNKPVEEVAREAVMAHRQAQGEFSRVHGVPADQLLRLPKDAADPGWSEVHKRMGVPEKPEEYQLTGLKFADGTAPDDTFMGHMRALAHDLKLPPSAAQSLAERVMALSDSDRSNATQSDATQRAANDAELRRNWGPQHDYYAFQTARAAQLLGVPDELMRAMHARPTAEYMSFMDRLRAFAGKMGEAELLRGERGDQSRTLSREEAIARREELSRDQDFVRRYIGGDANAVKEMDNLARVIVGPPPQAAPPGMR